MILLSLSALVLGVGLQMQPQTAVTPTPVSAPTTAVMAITSLKSGAAISDVTKLVQDEVGTAVQLYLDGKIDQWYTRTDGKGAVLVLRCQTTDEAKAIIASLPFMKAGYLNVEYIPVGPFVGLRALTRSGPAADPAAPR